MIPERQAISLEELQQRCTFLERALENENLTTPEQNATRRPSAEITQAQGAEVWLEYLLTLKAHFVRGSATAPASNAEDGRLSPGEALRQMAHAVPIRVKLDLDRLATNPDSTAWKVDYPEGLIVHVFPKSAPTLYWLDSLDAQMMRLHSAARKSLALEMSDDDRLLMMVPLAECLAVRLWAWVLTHPGCGMPFDPYAATAAEPPAHFWLLSESDCVRIFLAHTEIHGTRPRVVAQALGSGEKKDSRLPLHGVLAAWADEKGGPTADVLEQWSIGEIVSATYSRAFAQREATKRADRKTA